MDAQFFRYKQAYEGILKEDRKQDVKYTALKAGSKKEAGPKDEIGAIIAELQEHQAAYASKLANELIALNDQQDTLTKDLNGLKDKLQELDKSYFDAEDMVANRILQTATLTLKFAKIAKDITESKEVTDVEKVKAAFQKIYTLIEGQMPQLKEQLDAIKAETIIVEEEIKKGTWRKPTVQKESLQAIREGFIDNVRQFWNYVKETGKKLKTKVQSWATKFDKTNGTIEDQLNALAKMV